MLPVSWSTSKLRLAAVRTSHPASESPIFLARNDLSRSQCLAHPHRCREGHFVTIELVHDPERGTVDLGTGISHLVIRVEPLDTTLADLAAKAIVAEPPGLPGGADGPRTSWITDPDGYRIELVQWPAR